MSCPIDPSLLPPVDVLCKLISDQSVVLPKNSLHPSVQLFLFGSILPSENTTNAGLHLSIYFKNYARQRFSLLIPAETQLEILNHYEAAARQENAPTPTIAELMKQEGCTPTEPATAPDTELRPMLQSHGLLLGKRRASTSSAGPSSLSRMPTLQEDSDMHDEEMTAVDELELYKPDGEWAHMKGRTFDKVTNIVHLSGGANCEVFYEHAELGGRTFGLINKKWDVWRDWDGFYSEIFLYASSAHLRPFQGLYVPRIVGVYATQDGYVDVLMEPPHNATRWTEAHPFTTPPEIKKKIVRAYKAIHKAGVMHNDTELRHMLITDQNDICLIDWQLSKSLHPNEDVDLKRCTKKQLESEMRRVKYLLDYEGARVKEINLWIHGDEAKYFQNQHHRALRAQGEAIGQLSDEEWDPYTEKFVRYDQRVPSWFNQPESKVTGRTFEIPSVPPQAGPLSPAPEPVKPRRQLRPRFQKSTTDPLKDLEKKLKEYDSEINQLITQRNECWVKFTKSGGQLRPTVSLARQAKQPSAQSLAAYARGLQVPQATPLKRTTTGSKLQPVRPKVTELRKQPSLPTTRILRSASRQNAGSAAQKCDPSFVEEEPARRDPSKKMRVDSFVSSTKEVEFLVK